MSRDVLPTDDDFAMFATPKTYKTVGDALADPTSNLHRFVYEEAPAAMRHNPTNEAEWADYFAFLADYPGHSTKAWRQHRAS